MGVMERQVDGLLRLLPKLAAGETTLLVVAAALQDQEAGVLRGPTPVLVRAHGEDRRRRGVGVVRVHRTAAVALQQILAGEPLLHRPQVGAALHSKQQDGMSRYRVNILPSFRFSSSRALSFLFQPP